MASGKGIRIRLCFEEGMLNEAQVEQGLSKSWYLVNAQILTIGQLSFRITVDFHLAKTCPNGVTLEMSGFALPPSQPTSLLQDAELVSVKRKMRLTADELTAVSAAGTVGATRTKNIECSEKVLGARYGGEQIRSVDAFELKSQARQSGRLEKGAVRSRAKAVEIGLQLLRTKETVRRRKRICDDDIPIHGKEIVTGKANDLHTDETTDAAKDAADRRIHGGDVTKLADLSENHERTVLVGEAEKISIATAEEEEEVENSDDDKDEPSGLVESPDVNQSILSVPLALEAEPVQDEFLHQQKILDTGNGEGPARRRQYKENPSERNETWCKNRFDFWRKQQGIDTSKSLEELPYEELGTLLSKFFLMITKDNGERYPSASLMNLFMSFNRMIVKAQQERIKRTGIEEESFKIQTHPCFQEAGQSCNKAMEMSRYSGVNKKRTKAACISLEVEKLILSHPEHQATFPTGVQKRLAYYLWTVFLIRGNEEMWNLKFHDFSVVVDEKGSEFLQYNLRAKKKYKVIITQAQDKVLQPPSVSYEADVLHTFKVLSRHMPPNSGDGHLFLSPIRDSRTVVWFKQGINVSKGMIRLWMNTMTEVVGADGEFTSKSRRVLVVAQ